MWTISFRKYRNVDISEFQYDTSIRQLHFNTCSGLEDELVDIYNSQLQSIKTKQITVRNNGKCHTPGLKRKDLKPLQRLANMLTTYWRKWMKSSWQHAKTVLILQISSILSSKKLKPFGHTLVLRHNLQC